MRRSAYATRALLLLALVPFVTAFAPVTDPTHKLEGGWEVVRSPNVGSDANSLWSVDGVSTGDVWAVGTYSYSAPTGAGEGTLVEHWDGTRWRVVPSPSPSPYLELVGVAAVSSDDAWAVGDFVPDELPYYGKTLTLHWDGTMWTLIPSPNESGYDSYLSAVAAVSANDVWAVGHYTNYDFDNEALAIHWDGTQWTLVTPLGRGIVSYLRDVSASSSSDVWAVGSYFNIDGSQHALIQHWDGSRWSDFSPPETEESSDVWDVSALSANEAWALGDWGDANVFWHWDGVRWARSRAPIPQDRGGLTEVDAVSTEEAWAVGAHTTGLNSNASLILHWNGHRWQRVRSPSPGALNPLTALTVISQSDVWAVGVISGPDHVSRTLTEHFSS